MTHIQLFETIIGSQFKESLVGNIYELKENKEPDYPITKIKKKGKAILYSFDLNSKRTVNPTFSQSNQGSIFVVSKK